MVMEFMDGRGLTQIINICELGEPQIAYICKQVF